MKWYGKPGFLKHSIPPLTVWSRSSVTTGKLFSALYLLKPSINAAYSNSTPSFHICTNPHCLQTENIYCTKADGYIKHSGTRCEGRPLNVSVILPLNHVLNSMQEPLVKEWLLTCNCNLPLSLVTGSDFESRLRMTPRYITYFIWLRMH